MGEHQQVHRRRYCHYDVLILMIQMILIYFYCFLEHVPIVDGFALMYFRLKRNDHHTHCFSSSRSDRSRRFPSVLFLTTETQQQRQRKKYTKNPHVRSIVEMIESRYPPDDDDGCDDWSRTRAYLYRAGGPEKLPLQQVIDVLDFLDEYIQSPTICKHILQEVPRIFKKPVDSFLKPTAEFMRDELWGPELFLKAMERNPSLLLSSGVGYISPSVSSSSPPSSTKSSPSTMDVEQVLKSSSLITLSSTSIQKLKRSSPFVFGLSSTKVKSVLRFLSTILKEHPRDINIPSSVGKIVVSYPTILNLGIETNLQPSINFFQIRCGLDEAEIAKLIQATNGSVLGLSIEKNLRPTIDYLLKELLENDRKMLQKCLLSHPQLLGLSLKNLKSKVQFFESLSGHRSEDVSKSLLPSQIAKRCPAVYSLSLQDNIIPTMQFLCKVWGVPSSIEQHVPGTSTTNDEHDGIQSTSSNEDYSDNDHGQHLSNLLQEYPTILTLSLEGNIQPTMDFFNRTGYTQLTDNWELVKGNTVDDKGSEDGGSKSNTSTKKKKKNNSSHRIRGRYIAASLFNRLLPRWHYCLSKNRGPGGDDDNSQIPLHVLASANDAMFCHYLETDVKDFTDFKKDAIPSLKFSSQFDTWLKTGRRIDI